MSRTGGAQVSAINPSVDLSESQQGDLRAISYAITSLAAVFVALRMVARRKRNNVGLDDYMLLVALVLLFIFCATILIMIHYGLGLHSAALTPNQLTKLPQYLLVMEIIYVVTNGLIKVSLLMMYYRIFPVDKIRWGIYITGFMSTGWTISIIPVSIFQCRPVAKAWIPLMPGTCIHLKAAFIATGAINILTDSLILCLPMPFVWRLHTNLYRRISLMFIFSLGSFVVFASIYRFSTIFDFDPVDTSWTLAKSCIWCLVECAAGIISTCLPTLRPLFGVVSSKFGSSKEESKLKSTIHTDTVIVGGSGGKRFQRINDRALRPRYDNKFSSSIERTKKPGPESGDEVPLNVINVRTDLEWTESNCSPSASMVAKEGERS